MREIVVALRETPEQINVLRESWLDAGGSALTITPIAKERFETALGSEFQGVADLVELIENLARRAKGDPVEGEEIATEA